MKYSRTLFVSSNVERTRVAFLVLLSIQYSSTECCHQQLIIRLILPALLSFCNTHLCYALNGRTCWSVISFIMCLLFSRLQCFISITDIESDMMMMMMTLKFHVFIHSHKNKLVLVDLNYNGRYSNSSKVYLHVSFNSRFVKYKNSKFLYLFFKKKKKKIADTIIKSKYVKLRTFRFN